MNGQNTQSRTVLPIVLVVLGIVLIWWLWIWPHTSVSKAHRREAEMKEKLQSIRPPDGVKPSDIQITRLPQFGYISATRLDPAKLDCISGETYYKNEFTNAGLGYNGEKVDPKQHTKTLSFDGQGYGASVLCAEPPGVQSDLHIYVISMWSVVK